MSILSSHPPENKPDPTFWRSTLFKKIIVRTFLCVLCIQLLLLYPLVQYYEKTQLDNIEKRGLSSVRSLFTSLSKTATPAEVTIAAEQLMKSSPLRGLVIAREDGTPFIRIGEKPGHPMNDLPPYAFFFNTQRAEDGKYYDVGWDNEEENIQYDVRARFDASAIAPKIWTFTFLILGLMICSSLFITIMLLLILMNSVLRPVMHLKTRLTNLVTHPKQPERYLVTQYSQDELGDIEKKCNDIIGRLSDAQKTMKAQESVLELRVEERTQELSQLVNYDVITKLPNRKLLKNRLEEFLQHAKKDQKNVAVLYLLLADYHEINNAFGQTIGHQFLKEVAKNLSENAPSGACVAHLSTSQFAIAKAGLTGTHHVTNLVQWILNMFTRPIAINGQNILTTVNIGTSLYPMDGMDAETLMNNANLALNRAKSQAPNSFQFYEANMNKVTESRRSMLTDLHYALERNQLLAYYQPKVDLKTRKIIGVESLMRWQHPEKGLIPPDLFITLAEESGLIIGMGEWMLKTSCEQAMKWQEAGLPALTMAVNLSGVQFKQKNIVELINRVLIETGLPHEQLELEITESIIMDNIEESINIMKALHGIGPVLAIDDFGTGYSSLNYLRRFPIQKLKVDQSFVRDLDQDNTEKPLADIILLLAKTLNLHTIAEGIETEEQARYLEERGCQEGQGYLFGKPMPADEIAALLKQ